MKTSPARLAANRLNAQRSTGPKTPEGKSRSRMNALRHGLTGQVLLMPEENLAAFQKHCKIFFDYYKPQSPMESRQVQKIAMLQWRVDRGATYETNMLAVGEFENQMKFDAGHAQINTAVTETTTLRDWMPTFSLISVYEQRLERMTKAAINELYTMQSRRKYEEARQQRAPKDPPEDRDPQPGGGTGPSIPAASAEEPSADQPPPPKKKSAVATIPTNNATSTPIGFVYSAPAENELEPSRDQRERNLSS